MVSAQLRAYIRKQVANFLTDSCMIDREKTAVDEFGAPTHDWETVNVAVPCRIIKAGQFNTPAGATPGSQETLPDAYRLIVAHTVALDIDYRVTINGNVFYVVRLETDLTDEGFHAALISRQRGAI